MQLSAKPILLSDTSYSDTSTTHMLSSNNSRYYQTPHIIINTSTYYSYTLYHTIIIITTGHPIFMICHNIVNHIILLSDTYVIIKHLILLSTLQPINLKLHTILK